MADLTPKIEVNGNPQPQELVSEVTKQPNQTEQAQFADRSSRGPVPQEDTLATQHTIDKIATELGEIDEVEGENISLEQMREILAESDFWHGTGRFQYRDKQIIDVLDGMLRDGSITPHLDPYDLKTGTVSSTSLANTRAYAEGFALMHLYEIEELGYQYLTRKQMMKPIKGVVKKAVKGLPKYVFRRIKETLTGKKNNGQSLLALARNNRNWYAKVRSEKSNDYPDKLTKIKSDIKGNYPIVIGIRRDAVVPSETASYIAKHETRTQQGIPFSGVTHIEVPEAHIMETRELFARNGIEVAIIPIEQVERYSAQFTPDELIKGNPFKQPQN